MSGYFGYMFRVFIVCVLLCHVCWPLTLQTPVLHPQSQQIECLVFVVVLLFITAVVGEGVAVKNMVGS
jgi:hypothetical protein